MRVVPTVVHYISPARAQAFREVSVRHCLGPARVYASSPYLVLLVDAPEASISVAVEEEAAAALGQYVDLRSLSSVPSKRRAATWERAAPLVSASLIGVQLAGDAQ